MSENTKIHGGMRIQLRDQISDLAEEPYRQFSSKLLPGTEGIVGVRLPILRKLVKRYLKQDWRMYLEEVFGSEEKDFQSACIRDQELFEEVMFQGMLIGYAPLTLKERFFYLERFIPKIDNWSVCDSVCTTMKFAKEYPKETWDFLLRHIHSSEEYSIRFAVVMYINYFINAEYYKEVLRELNEISHPAYYVKMAIAWAVSMCYVFNTEETKVFLSTCRLDDFTYNKAIQKIIESRQVDKEEKEKMRKWKRQLSCVEV